VIPPGERRWLWVRRAKPGQHVKDLWHLVSAEPVPSNPHGLSWPVCTASCGRFPWDWADPVERKEWKPRTVFPPNYRFVCPECYGYWHGYTAAIVDVKVAIEHGDPPFRDKSA
jgi:hypothetical protein